MQSSRRDNPVRHIADGIAGNFLDSLRHCCIQGRNNYTSGWISQGIS